MKRNYICGCEYCENKKNLGYDGAGDAIYIGRYKTMNISAIESDTWVFLIKYCPMCGRKLKEET